ncbi:NUDIX hydrolase [Chitinophaga rhizophila]|uniref:NUDIX domain-containing protein n=1 Tax=Chitinophaga rhizophila TaxID=2866212 RepID=A0ABS7G9L5_9BACT|nr:NUDIX domain-containing protein [Chitinophaga rhizophila]MBW8684357.1 NUDIX domain-containing protein [Chitinophaga rhizophila]
MTLEELLKDQSEEAPHRFLAHISIDCVVFGFNNGIVKVLLVRMKGEDHWMLPGGYVEKHENTDDAAIRILEARSGTKKVYLQQFATFGAINRSQSFFKLSPELWHAQRFISIGYFAMVDFNQVIPVPDDFSDKCEWLPLNNLPPLAMDHRQIINKALKTLQTQLNYQPIGLDLLPEEFTLPELQKLYESILGKPLNRGNFYRKIMALDILEKQDEQRKGGAHKSPNLYRFNLQRYQEAFENGIYDRW